MDVDNRGGVNVTDLLALLAAWGSCLPPPARPTSTVMAVVNVTDLLARVGCVSVALTVRTSACGDTVGPSGIGFVVRIVIDSEDKPGPYPP